MVKKTFSFFVLAMWITQREIKWNNFIYQSEYRAIVSTNRFYLA